MRTISKVHCGFINVVNDLKTQGVINWLKRIPAGSITTWEDITTRFLAQFFPPGRTAKLRNDILMFQQHHGESLSEAWARFKDLLWKVPHHGLDLWLQVQILYDHADCTTQIGIDYTTGGRLRKLRPDKAWATIERHPIHSGDVIDWEFLARQNLDQAFFNSISTDPFSGPQWGNLFHVNEPVYRELGEQKEISLLELGWRVGLYYERQSRENATLSGLRNGDTVKESRLLMEFWPTIRDGGFNVGNNKVASIRDPRVKLAHRCIATTIARRKKTTHRVTKIDLYYLYYVYTPKVACNIPYWLSKYLKGVREKNLIYGGVLVTKIARSFGLLTDELRDALSIEPPPHMFKKKSLIAMGVIMELQNGMCVWPAPQAVEEEEEAEEEAEGDEDHDGDGGSTAMYQIMSQGDWQVHQARLMDQQDEQWGRLNN
ncbi:zinc finger, CCHC-type containing protein [Tanacetum coccineum]